MSISPEKLQKIKLTLKKELPKEKFVKSNSLISNIKKNFKNHPLYFKSKVQFSTQQNKPPVSSNIHHRQTSMKTIENELNTEQILQKMKIGFQLIRPFSESKIKFKQIKQEREYLWVASEEEEWTMFLDLIEDSYISVKLPRSIIKPPQIRFGEKLFLKRTSNKVQWFVKH